MIQAKFISLESYPHQEEQQKKEATEKVIADRRWRYEECKEAFALQLK
jgi:hypothetical protein